MKKKKRVNKTRNLVTNEPLHNTNVLLDKCIKICLGSFFTRRNDTVIKQIQIALHCTKKIILFTGRIDPVRYWKML